MRVGIWNGAAALLLAAALSGCVTGNINPVTGNRIYTPVSAATEAYYGGKANAQIVADYGVYKEDAALAAYVDRIGQALAKNTVRQDIKYTFTILNDDGINGFALPGGYVYITRGVLNYANSEAEVAAIIAHEIGHVDAFHFGRTKGSTVKRVFSVLLRHSSTNPDDLALAQRLADESSETAAYSQEQEFEADALGIHYLALAGYDPEAMVRAIRTDDAKTRLDDGGMKGNAVAHDILALDESHPATPEREARAVAAVQKTLQSADTAAPAGAAKRTEREAYLAAVDGMSFGADPAEGAVEGRRLVNAALGFSFEAPKDFDLWTSHGGAFGAGRNAVLLLEAAEAPVGQSLVSYVQSAMMEKMPVENVRTLEIAGYHGATGIITVDRFVVRLGAVRDDDNHLYKLLYVAPRRGFGQLDGGFLESLKSFHPLQGAEAKPRPALRLRVVTVAGGDTVESLAARMALKEQKLEWFRLLNGLEASDAVKPGDRVKLVAAQ